MMPVFPLLQVDPNVPTRGEFLHFSVAEKLLFYGLTFLAIGYMGWQIAQRVRLWMQGRPISPTTPGWRYWVPQKATAMRWWSNVWSYVLLQKKVKASRKRSGAPMHLFIFYGFLAMLVATTLLGIATYFPYNFHRGGYYLLYEATFDTLGLGLIIGLGWAIVRRAKMVARDKRLVEEFAARPVEGERASAGQLEQNRRAPLSHSPWDMGLLVLLFALSINGYLLEAARISNNPKPWDSWSWVGYGLSQILPPVSDIGYKTYWWFHIVLVLAFFVILPKLRIRHTIIAIASLAGMPSNPMGKLRTIPMEEVEETEQVGVKFGNDLTRWNLLSLDACMECGRCTEVCPAWNVGKVLNPKQVVQDIKISHEAGLEVAPKVSYEALWECTTCNACVEICPVGIKHVDMIVDIRRNLVSEGALAGSGATMLRQTQSTGNAWGQRGGREDWMKDLDVPLCRDGVEFDVLFWVGCAGATDPAAIRTTKSVAKLLNRAGVKYACLGDEEACTGDPARRTGEEFLFQERAMENVSIFERYGVKRVVTACPHCFNTLKNEYGDFSTAEGGESMEVFHHTQFLQELVLDGKLVSANAASSNVVFHDPCYLGRVNDETGAPHRIAKGMALPVHNGKRTRCCGAGGGRMWMDEEPHERPANARAAQLLEAATGSGAPTVAMGCPFCRIMLEAPLKEANEDVKIVDVSELMVQANESTSPAPLGPV